MLIAVERRLVNSWEAPMATADNAGTEIHYEITGEGTPVALLHGFPDSGRLWRHQVPALTGAGYRVIGPGSHAGKLPTGSVAVRCPDQSRDRAGRWILLADARHRVGGIPGLTSLLLCGYLGRESEASALNLGTYEVCGHSINEVMSAVLGSLPLDQPLKSKPAGLATCTYVFSAC
jgi:hypothetical protein